MTNEFYMNRAIELAYQGTGYVSPNPRVGAVIVKNGVVIGEGWHKKFGAPHAEIEAIENCKGIDLSGATLYVNLEPCTHYGKTPPCTNAIIEKKFDKVVIGMTDPNPVVSGRGIAMLKDAGINVESDVLPEDCKWVNRFFVKNITTKLPYIIIKTAQTFDGNIATATGESKWITNPESRKAVHALRFEVDAVLVGRRTVLNDNPSLTVRDIEGRNPIRIIFDSSLSLPVETEIFNDSASSVIVCCKPESSDSRKAELLKSRGINILPVWQNNQGKLDIQDAISKLAREFNIASILVEGGASIFSSFITEKIYDELHLFIAPKIIGKGINVFGEFQTRQLIEAPLFKIKGVIKRNTDIQVIAVKS
jgi:diaminohydroxyphosphoribosylaminopyrimidine deaminase/5-amino-6-(5-phosphoribosylamino)uracil reductase